MNKKDQILAASTIAVLTIIISVLLISPTMFFIKKKSSLDGHVHEFLKLAYNTFHISHYGIIHIGARHAEELPIYKHYKIKDILWIEADPTAEQKLLDDTVSDPHSKLAFFAATDQNGTINLYRTTNDGHSSSILKLKNHLYMSPTVLEEQLINVPQKRLDDYLNTNANLKNIKYNIIVIDVQGAELIALKGAINTLQNIDAIIAEVNYDELYEGAVNIRDLDTFLIKHNFVRVDTMSVNRAYGDALYVKTSLCSFKSL